MKILLTAELEHFAQKDVTCNGIQKQRTAELSHAIDIGMVSNYVKISLHPPISTPIR